MGEVIGEEAIKFRVELADAVQNAMYVFRKEMAIVDSIKQNRVNIKS